MGHFGCTFSANSLTIPVNLSLQRAHRDERRVRLRECALSSVAAVFALRWRASTRRTPSKRRTNTPIGYRLIHHGAVSDCAVGGYSALNETHNPGPTSPASAGFFF